MSGLLSILQKEHPTMIFDFFESFSFKIMIIEKYFENIFFVYLINLFKITLHLNFIFRLTEKQ